MSDKQFTLFELHFNGDLQIGPRSLGSGTEGDADASTTIPELGSSDGSIADEADEESGSSVLAPLFALGLLAALGYAVKRLLAGESGAGLDALDDIEADAEDRAEELQDETEDAVPIEITDVEAEEGRGIGVAVAAAVVVLLVVAAVVRKLLTDSEEIVVEE
jgi:hypothetical protein